MAGWRPFHLLSRNCCVLYGVLLVMDTNQNGVIALSLLIGLLISMLYHTLNPVIWGMDTVEMIVSMETLKILIFSSMHA